MLCCEQGFSFQLELNMPAVNGRAVAILGGHKLIIYKKASYLCCVSTYVPLICGTPGSRVDGTLASNEYLPNVY